MLSADQLRPLPVALARRMASLKPDDPQQDVCKRLYRRLTPKAQLQCRIELLEIGQAKRGEFVPEIWFDLLPVVKTTEVTVYE